jgi:endogenous inhibitor of DNA gyrase (YacG/DUF329 family)
MSEPVCPICSKPAVERYKPFCSKRCADVDLSRWLKGSYAIAGEPAGEEDDMPVQTPDRHRESDQ